VQHAPVTEGKAKSKVRMRKERMQLGKAQEKLVLEMKATYLPATAERRRLHSSVCLETFSMERELSAQSTSRIQFPFSCRPKYSYIGFIKN